MTAQDTLLATAERSIVVVIDLQGKLVDLVHRPTMVKAASRRLMQLADLFEVPVVLTEQYPRGLGETHADVLETFDSLTVAKRRLAKTSFGCMGDAGFVAALDELRPDVPVARRQLVLAGIETHVCVLQTALEAISAGYEVQLCWEAVSGRGAEYRQWALERMAQAGVVITNHESVAFEWARHKDDARFKSLSALLKTGQIEA